MRRLRRIDTWYLYTSYARAQFAVDRACSATFCCFLQLAMSSAALRVFRRKAAARKGDITLTMAAPFINSTYSHNAQFDCWSQNVPSKSSKSSSSSAVNLSILYTNCEVVAHSWIHSNIHTSKASSGNQHAAGAANSHSSAIASTNRGVVVGFDAEWKPRFQKGQKEVLGTLQFATMNAVLVYQLNAARRAPNGHAAAGCLGRLLADPTCTFVGMGVHADFDKVQHLAEQAARASSSNGSNSSSSSGHKHRLVELKQFGTDRGVNVSGGLAGLAMHLHPAIAKWKTKTLQMSDWSRYPLDHARVRYAAMDAWASVACYHKLAPLELVLPSLDDPMPLPPAAVGQVLAVSSSSSQSHGSGAGASSSSSRVDAMLARGGSFMASPSSSTTANTAAASASFSSAASVAGAGAGAPNSARKSGDKKRSRADADEDGAAAAAHSDARFNHADSGDARTGRYFDMMPRTPAAVSSPTSATSASAAASSLVAATVAAAVRHQLQASPGSKSHKKHKQQQAYFGNSGLSWNNIGPAR